MVDNPQTSTTVNINGQKITWTTDLGVGETKTLYIKVTINENALSEENFDKSQITGDTADWWATNNDEKDYDGQLGVAQVFIRLDGEILENDENEDQDTSEYAKVGTVNLKQKNSEGNGYTTEQNAIRVGTETTPTTVEEYAALNYKIFQHVLDGTDLEHIETTINNGDYTDSEGNKVTFDSETQMIVCYVLKYYGDEGYHIDAVIRDRVQTRVDLYKVGNTATVNGNSSDVDITVSTVTELTDYTVEKQWNDAGKESERPEIDVNLYDGQGNFVATTTLNKDNNANMTYTFENLDKKDSNGNDIQYTAKEVNIDVENETTTIYEEGELNGNYIVSYNNSEEGKTVITNTYSQPNITVEKTQTPKFTAEETPTVEYGDKITYTIIATNNGTAAGSVTIKDDKPANTAELKDGTQVNIEVQSLDGTTIETRKPITLNQLRNEGYTTSVDKQTKVVISFTVIADGYAGEDIENTAEYKKDNEGTFTDTDTVKSDLEDSIDLVTSETVQTADPQKVILLLDYSGSMNYAVYERQETWWGGYENVYIGTREEVMRDAVDSFLEVFLPEGTENQVMVIPYGSDTDKGTLDYTSNPTAVTNFLNKKSPGGGTNIHAALKDAYNDVDENTTVILMSDGNPTFYREYDSSKWERRWWDDEIIEEIYQDENGESYAIHGDGNTYDDTGIIDAANAIKGKYPSNPNKIYTIGFGISDFDNPNNQMAQLMTSIATEATETNRYCYGSATQEELVNVFSSIAKTITKTENADPKPIETKEGVVTLEGIEAGQNVELYTEYDKDDIENSTLYKTPYSWTDFLGLTVTRTAEDGREETINLVSYNEGTKTLTFNLGAYMKSEGMEKDQNLTIRFVDPNAESKIAPANILSLAINAIADDTINEETVSEYEEKMNAAEENKNVEATEPVKSETDKNENIETTKPDNEAGNVETTKPDNEAGNVEDNTENTTQGTTTDQEETNTPTVEEKPEEPVEEPATGTTTETENTVQETTSNIDVQTTE